MSWHFKCRSGADTNIQLFKIQIANGKFASDIRHRTAKYRYSSFLRDLPSVQKSLVCKMRPERNDDCDARDVMLMIIM